MFNVSLKNGLLFKELRNRLEVVGINDELNIERMGWLSHVTRMDA